jgi:hypothetical protein
VAAGCGGDHRRPPAGPAATATPGAAAPPAPTPAGAPSLAVGITEFSAPLVAAPGTLPAVQPFARRRDQLAALHPAYFRLVVEWGKLQPSPSAPPNLAEPQAGCSRRIGPCAPYAGVRDQLRALASRQRGGGWQALVVITDTPAWAAAPPSGCRRGAVGTMGAPVRRAALPAYGRLVTDVLALARREGAELRYWSAWNEPNLALFLAPQRRACAADSPSVAAAAYVPLARALQRALAAAPGEQELALAELAGATRPTARRTTVGEFVGALPRDLVCSAAVWTQHAYVGGPDPVDALVRAVKARGCGELPPIWITETGVGAVDSTLAAARGITSALQGCRALHRRLVAWWRDPRVTAAFQYTFRSDPAFPTGLVSSNLAHARPTLREWQAWGARASPSDPPPEAAC